MHNENKLKELSDSIKHNNICIIKVLEEEEEEEEEEEGGGGGGGGGAGGEEEREKGKENLFEEIVTETFSDLGRKHIQINEHREPPTKSTKADPHQDIL